MAGKKKTQETGAYATELFGGFQFGDPEAISEVKTVEKLDLFKEVLPAIERKDYAFYRNLPKERQKLYQPYVVQRWLSNSTDHDGMHHYYLGMTNELVNRHFWDVSNHPELQHMLMCAAASGMGSRVRHNWLPFVSGKKKKSVIRDFFRNMNASLNDDELDMLISITTDVEFKAHLESLGLQDVEVKAMMKDWKAEKK